MTEFPPTLNLRDNLYKSDLGLMLTLTLAISISHDCG